MTITLTKEQLIEKVGKQSFLADEYSLIAILNYENGIPTFDKYLDGKTVKQINAVIHLIKYPKGFIIKIAKLFSSFPFGLEYSSIKKMLIVGKPDLSELTFDTTDERQIKFTFKTSKLNEVKQFFDDIHMKYDYVTTFITKTKTVKEKTIPTNSSTVFNSAKRKK